jgi:hypothetical protein
MAVTDLTDSLPWWARQGGAPQSGAPTPPGAHGMTSWLDYLASMFNTPAQAGEAPPTNGGPSPDDIEALKAAQAAQGGQGGPPAPDNRIPVVLPPQPTPRPAGPPVGAGMLDQSGVQRGPMGVLRTQPGASAPVGAGLPDQSGVARNAAGVVTPGAPGPASPVAAPAARVPGPMAGGGATSNPRFIGLDYRPNASPQNSMRAGPQATALNLAGLFGGQGGAVNPNVPAANAQPVSAVRGPMAQGRGMVPSTYPGDNWDIDAQGNVVPNYGSSPNTTGPLQRPPRSSVARARILQPNYYG